MLINCHTFFSHTFGTIPTSELVKNALEAGYNSMALTDINNTCTAIDFIRLCYENSIKPILGIDFRNMDISADTCFIGLARNNAGFMELNTFLSEHLHNKTPFEPSAPDFENVTIIYPFGFKSFEELKPNEYIGIKPHHLNKLIQVSEKHLRSKSVALYPVSYLQKDEFYLHCLLRAIDKNIILSKLEPKDAASRSEYLISKDELTLLYAQFSFLLSNTQKVMEECEIDMDYSTDKNKTNFFGSVGDDVIQFKEKCMQGLDLNYFGKATYPDALARMEKELKVITAKNFTGYFLISDDVVQYARRKGYFHAGRGSGANSIAAYCLGITGVDPIEHNLFFERFLNMHRSSPPDFDLDFSWKDKDDILAYLFRRYGKANTALLGSHSTIKFRAAMRELGKVYGLPKGEMDEIIYEKEIQRFTGKVLSPADKIRFKMLYYGNQLTKFPRHLSVHSSGVVISQNPIFQYTSTSLPPIGFPVTHFDMYTAESFKLFKLDILSQRGLGHIKDCISLVKENQNIEIDIHRTDEFVKDERLNKLLSVGQTIGCFYIESPAMRQLLTKLKCSNFNTLVAASSIIRPGVSESGMSRQYVRMAREPDLYKPAHPKLQELLGETYGVMVYQEDIIKVASEFAGISLANADLLRRAMAWKFRVDNGFEQLEKEYFDNCRALGYPEDVIQEVWRQMEGFAGFSFCKAHSASYAVESYQSLYLKTYFPKEFMVAVINNFGGYYNTEFYINELRNAGANLHAPCVNRSEYLTNITGNDVYIGLIHLKSLQETLAKEIISQRNQQGPYQSLSDLNERVRPGMVQLNLLIRIGGFRFTGQTKRQLLWEACLLYKNLQPDKGMKLLFTQPVKKFEFPPMKQGFREDALEEIELLGFPLCSRFELLTNKFRGEIKALDMLNNEGKSVTMAGYLTNSKYTRTSKGDYMQFGSFVDDEGQTFETVLFPNIFKKYFMSYKAIYALKGKIKVEYDVPILELEKCAAMQVSFSPEHPGTVMMPDSVDAGQHKQLIRLRG